MKVKKRKIPYIFRNKVSCPECGYIFKEYEYKERLKDYFSCPKCDTRFSDEEFWEENIDKWSRKMRETND
jgi:hypothetical protein